MKQILSQPTNKNPRTLPPLTAEQRSFRFTLNSFATRFTAGPLMMDRVLLPYKLFTFSLRLESDQPVSRFPAATLRGGFGYTLRGLVCATPKIPCRRCLLKHQCAYSFLFETPPPPNAARLGKYHAVPRPFALRPRFDRDSAELELLLVGNAVPYLPHFIYALNTMGRKGIGKRRLRFEVTNVRTGDTTVFPIGDNEVTPDIEPDNLTVEPGEPRNGRVTLRFVSPFVIRKNGAVLDRFEPQAFVTTLLRRVTNLDAFFGSRGNGVDPTPYVEAARELTVTNDLQMENKTRISTRQKKKIDYSGLTGNAELRGNVGTLMPLLRAGEVVGVGKNTVFGYGVYSIKSRRANNERCD